MKRPRQSPDMPRLGTGFHGFGLAAAGLFLLCQAVAVGDVIELTNGRKIEGIIVEENESRVVLRTSGGEIPLTHRAIASIKREDPRHNALLLADRAFAAQHVSRGFEGLISAIDLGAGSQEVNTPLVENERAILRGVERMTAGERPECRQVLKRLQTFDQISPEGHRILAKSFVELGAEPEASLSIHLAGRDVWKNHPDDFGWAVRVLTNLIRRYALEGQYAKSVQEIERLRLLDEKSAWDQELLTGLSASARARDEGDYAKALQILAEELWPRVPGIASNRAVILLRQLSSWAIANEKEEEAREWIRTWLLDILPMDSRRAINRLAESQAARLLQSDHPGEALKLIEDLQTGQRSEPLQTLWRKAKFRVDREAIGESDPLALFRLAQWAGENKLYEDALLELENLRTNEVLRPHADELATVLKSERDGLLFQQALDAYERGLIYEVAEFCTEITEDTHRKSSYYDQAQELLEIAEKEISRERDRAPYLAESFYQEAERAFFTERLDESWNLLDLILRKYPETPAAERAARLLPDVARQFEIQLLEGKRSSLPTYDPSVSTEVFRRTDQLSQEVTELLEALGNPSF